MNEQEKKLRRNRIRKLLLQFLAKSYPNPIDAILVRRGLSDLGYPIDEEQLVSYLAYLSERGYVVVKEKKDFGIRLIRITATGLNLVDGDIEDPGVGVKI